MRIDVNVKLAKGETLAYAPDAAAMQVLVALGGNSTKDSCYLVMVASPEPGHAGVSEPPVGP